MNQSTDDIENEAATWLARLHADRCDSADQVAFRAWLNQSPAHASAFEDATMVWETAGSLPRSMLQTPKKARIGRREVLAGIAVTTVAAGAVMVTSNKAAAKVYETKVGERQRIILSDNSAVTLDTDTRIIVTFTDSHRRIDLERGRVNFQTVPDARRPFIVSAAHNSVVADYSQFDVRRDGERLSVILLSGRASVQVGVNRVNLSHGQRLVSSRDGLHLDNPNLLPLLAWQMGQAILDDETLDDAVAEMNRYSEIKLTIGNREIANMRVSGVYKVGDNLAFARSVARLLPLRVTQAGDRVMLFMDSKRMRQG